MKNNIYILFISIFIFACTSNTIYKKPDDLISKDQMIDLLVDMNIALSAKPQKNIEGKNGIDYMPFVYEKYGIDSLRFAKSNYYYSTDIDQYSKILKTVKERIENQKKEFEVLLREKDSVEKKPNVNSKTINNSKKNLDSIKK
ncbi:DUF4296 domain-containing protein [Urechidicola croceus]|uniref:DUF4296 domain-containing protein n=1 Tax=Urechidicola croceus TaxID=1850246 RepID=A0A1D8P8X2_9FLAO|nr:DUF4296 domain-containing protein [Urechidicola croceus]AOW21031.1 hypothetical protein LPB138_10220 [Urechidicola croceus]